MKSLLLFDLYTNSLFSIKKKRERREEIDAFSVLVGCLVLRGSEDGEEPPPVCASHEPETYSLVCVPSQEKAAFRELITQLELDPKCRGLPLSSFLILPFQRIDLWRASA